MIVNKRKQCPLLISLYRQDDDDALAVGCHLFFAAELDQPSRCDTKGNSRQMSRERENQETMCVWGVAVQCRVQCKRDAC